MFRALQWSLSGDVPKDAFAAVSDDDSGAEGQWQAYQQQVARPPNNGGDWHEGMMA